MARKGLCLLLAAAILLAAPHRVGAAAPDDDKEKKVLNLLAVQKALQEGRDALKRGDFQAAVTVLEARVAYIDGNKEYLDALRDAYIGYIRELQKNNRGADVSIFVRRLECCDPGALLEINSAAHNTVAAPLMAKPVAATAPAKTNDVAAAPPARRRPTIMPRPGACSIRRRRNSPRGVTARPAGSTNSAIRPIRPASPTPRSAGPIASSTPWSMRIRTLLPTRRPRPNGNATCACAEHGAGQQGDRHFRRRPAQQAARPPRADRPGRARGQSGRRRSPPHAAPGRSSLGRRRDGQLPHLP